MTQTPEEQAYGQGYIACAEDKLITDNPYPAGALYEEWRKGWKHFDAEYNPTYYERSDDF